VSTPDGRADNRDRGEAIGLVEAALKAGRIVQVDRDMRVNQLEQAQTVQDIDMVVRDLRVPAAAAQTPPPLPVTPTGPSPAAPASAGGQPWPLVSYGPASHESVDVAAAVGKTGGRAIGGIVGAILLVSLVLPAAAGVIAFVNSRDSFPDFGNIGPTDETTYAPGEAPGKNGINVHTAEGFEDLVGAVVDKTGDAYVFSAVLYPRYAVLQVPTGTNQRYESFYWNGELSPNDIRGTTDDEQFDLSLVDPQQAIDMLNLVRGRLDAPTSWYVMVADHAGQDTQMTAYASNEFDESTYITQDLAGNVVYDSEAN
jgi:hypothetical protein